MSQLELIICLFPIVFMLHEFEEIIGLKIWFCKNGEWLKSKFPKSARQFTHMNQLSVPDFAFHIVLHIIQWMIVRKYIPVIITSLLSMPYLMWGANAIFTELSSGAIAICFIMGLPIAALNLYFIHKLALRFDKITTLWKQI